MWLRNSPGCGLVVPGEGGVERGSFLAGPGPSVELGLGDWAERC